MSQIPTGRRLAAFTLIELLVVISIIALLVALLLPALASATAAARTVQCTSNQRQVTMTLFMYVDNFQRLLPPYSSGGMGGEQTNFSQTPMGRMNAAGLVEPYPTSGVYAVGNRNDMRTCPEITTAPELYMFQGTSETRIGQAQNYTHFGNDQSVFGFYHQTTGWGATGGVSGPRTLDSFAGPSDVTAFFDARRQLSAPEQVRPLQNSDNNLYRFMIGADYSGSIYRTASVQNYRHQMRNVNFTFLDGHGETRGFWAVPQDPYAMTNSSITSSGFGPFGPGGFGRLLEFDR